MRHAITTLFPTLLVALIICINSVDAKLARRCKVKPTVSPNVLADQGQVSVTSTASSTKAKHTTTGTVTSTSSRHTVTVTVTDDTTSDESASSTTSMGKHKTKTSTSAQSSSTNYDDGSDDGSNDDNSDSNNSDPNVKTYKVKEEYSGVNFFDGFGFDDFADPTHGNVNYLKESDAYARGLAYVDDNGLVVMKVDNTNTIAAGSNRDSVRISSNNAYTSGLLVLDVDTMPYGCGVWPAFWTVGDNWPNGGEIDILEGVNNNVNAAYTLHTAPGCHLDTTFIKASNSKKPRHRSVVHSMMANARVKRDNSNGFSPLAFTGTVLASNCDATINSNTGCGIQDPSDKSYGSALNAGGGGVFATLLNSNGVAIWFFPRDSIPDDLSKKAPQPETWGSPKAFWSSSTCPTKSFFGAQKIVINTTLCGDWAGSAYSSDGSCPGTCAERVADPKNFDTAQWKIKSVIVYQ